MSTERGIASVNAPVTLHEDAIRLGRAAILPGQWARHDPFLSMMNDRFGPGAFGPHPHRGFETLTYVISGQLRHADSHGGAGVLGPGDVQWMTAGRGVVHDEQPVADTVHVLQLWINLPRTHKLAAPRYQDLRGSAMPVHTAPGVQVRVFADQAGDATGPAQVHTPLLFLDIRMQAGAQYRQSLPGSHNGFITLIQGAGRFGAQGVAAGADDTLWLAPADGAGPSHIDICATQPLHLILAAGEPIQEPVAAHGPFVMNTPQDIVQAIADYQSGLFGRL